MKLITNVVGRIRSWWSSVQEAAQKRERLRQSYDVIWVTDRAWWRSWWRKFLLLLFVILAADDGAKNATPVPEMFGYSYTSQEFWGGFENLSFLLLMLWVFWGLLSLALPRRVAVGVIPRLREEDTKDD